MTQEIKKYKHSLVFSKPDIADVGYSIWTPTIRDWRDVIEDYIEISKKRRNNKFAMFKLQTNLISDIVLINDTIKGYKDLIESPEEREKKFPTLDVTEENISYWKEEFISHKIILAALKDIGDGIAWRLLNYKHSLIYTMCVNNEDCGPLLVNQGLITELHALGDYANDLEVLNFVYHGITNFLLIGDLTLKYSNGDVNFVEIKSQKNQRGSSWKERVERQKARADNLITIANEGEGVSSGVKIKTHVIEGAPNVGLKKLRTF